MIRKATLEDVPQLVSLAIQMWKSHTVEDLTKIFCEHIRKGKNIIFLAISEEHIVGFAQCGLRFDYVEGTDSSPVGYLEGIFVFLFCVFLSCDIIFPFLTYGSTKKKALSVCYS